MKYGTLRSIFFKLERLEVQTHILFFRKKVPFRVSHALAQVQVVRKSRSKVSLSLWKNTSAQNKKWTLARYISQTGVA